MGRLLYYLPGNVTAGAAALRDAGLEYALPEGKRSWRHLREGPDGGHGLLVATTAARYLPTEQRWERAVLREHEWWIGVEGEISPDDVARDRQIPGPEIRLEDGSRWMIPVARWGGSSDHLPSQYRVGPDGDPILEPDPQWDPLIEDANRVEQIVDANDPETDVDAGVVTYPELFSIAVRALGVNYLVSREEIHALRLLGPESTIWVCLALTDATALAAVAHSTGRTVDELLGTGAS